MSKFKHGDIAQHPDKGYGIMCRYFDDLAVSYLGPGGNREVSLLLNGWEKVDVLPAGHVAVRVDDLDDDDVAQGSAHRASNRLLDAYYAWKDAQQPEEPMEIGSKVTDADGDKWIRSGADAWPWTRLRDGMILSWRDVSEVGPVTIGWGDDDE